MKCKHCDNYSLLDSYLCHETGQVTETQNKDGCCKLFHPRWYCFKAKKEWREKMKEKKLINRIVECVTFLTTTDKKVEDKDIRSALDVFFPDSIDRMFASIYVIYGIVAKVAMLAIINEKNKMEDVIWGSPT